VVLTGGGRHDAPGFALVLAQVPERNNLEYGVMDKAYDSDHIREQLRAKDITPVIPPKSKRKEAIASDQDQYKLREKVERFFNRLKQFRRIATRYEKLSQTFLAFIHIVASCIIIK
jgi:transposase